MEPGLSSYSNNDQAEETIVLDYLYGEGDALQALEIVRFARGQPWHILDQGLLLGSIQKDGAEWKLIESQGWLTDEMYEKIGHFIDAQHFNFLPGKIKKHWTGLVEEVVMKNESSYMVIAKKGVDFRSFKNIFSAFIGRLVEVEWPVSFKVYNASFTDEFEVRVY